MTAFLFFIMLAAAVLLYIKGWLSFEYTGVTKPLVSLAIFGLTIKVCRPEQQQP